MTTLDDWIDQQYRHCATAMLRSISPVDLVKHRPGFGQSIRASKGAVIASPVLAAYDPDPDYFFHWFRDSAVVMDALRLLHQDGTLAEEALCHFADFVRFSLELQHLDGRVLIDDRRWRTRVAADFEKFVRTDEDLGPVRGDAIVGETRVNPNGTLDISRWGRPQNDGSPLRALTVLGWFGASTFESQLDLAASALLRADLAYTCSHWRDACYDIWEEEKGQHYYTLCVSASAMERGSLWLNERGDASQAQALRLQARAIRELLDSYWSTEQGYYRSRILESAARSAKELDIAVILAAIHAPSSAATHSVRDPKMHATLRSLEALFSVDYPINQDLPPHRAPALGRYAGDVYYSGGAYYFSTLGASQFCFQVAQHSSDSRSWIARGDAYLQTVRAYTPSDGELSEQFDKKTGAQSSAKQLAWSYAAFISCVTARRAVVSSRVIQSRAPLKHK
jgi:glucoamylase